MFKTEIQIIHWTSSLLVTGVGDGLSWWHIWDVLPIVCIEQVTIIMVIKFKTLTIIKSTTTLSLLWNPCTLPDLIWPSKLKWGQLIFNFLTVWFTPPSDRFNRSVPDVYPSISTNHFINWLLDCLMTWGDTTKIEYMPYRQHWLRYFPVTSVILPEATENWIVVIKQEKIS